MSSRSPTRSPVQPVQGAKDKDYALPRTLLERLGYEVVVDNEWFDAQESPLVRQSLAWQLDNQICVSGKGSSWDIASTLWHELGHALLYLDVVVLNFEGVKNWWPYPRWLKGVDEYTLETYAGQAELAAQISTGDHAPAHVTRTKDRPVPCGFPIYQMHRLEHVLKIISVRAMY